MVRVDPRRAKVNSCGTLNLRTGEEDAMSASDINFEVATSLV